MKNHLKFILVVSFAAAALGLRAEEEMTTASVKLSDPSKPGTLRINIPWADLRVQGGDVAEITVRSSLDEKSKSKQTRNGLRRIDEVVSFELTEKENTVTVEIAGGGGWHGHGAEFDITVPRNTNLVLGNGMGGEIIVRGVEGDLDIDSMNGDVNVDGVASSAVINTMNGEITANFKLPPAKPVSLSTMNGEINVRLPAETKASLRLRTHNGSVLTDFPEDILKTKAETTVNSPNVINARSRVRLTEREAADEARARAERDERRARSDAAREAAEAVRIAAEVARTVAEEVKREVELAVAEANGSEGRFAPRAPGAPLPPFGGKSIVGTLNGGGTDISITSMNGTITLRQTEK